MKKPTSLRTALDAALPEFRDNPDRLKLWIEDGSVRVRQTATHGFAYEYPLAVYLKDARTDIAIVTHAINRWLRANQPDLLAGGAGDSYKFEADLKDGKTADILFTIELTEHVAITKNEDDSWAIDYLAEPDPLFDEYAPVGELADTPPLTGVDTIVADAG